jgi:uncharacterized protein (DUF169 family)
MSPTPKDLAILDKFKFERKPVGVKFLATRPKGLKRPEKQFNFCEMLKEAQEGNAFYVGPEDWVCMAVSLTGKRND